MTDPALRDKILGAFFQGPDAAVEFVREMLADAFEEGQRGGGANPYRGDGVFTGRCIHVPPSPGQSLCQCRHQQIEMEYAARVAELSPVRGKIVNIKAYDVATGEMETVGSFDYSQDERGRGTFLPIEPEEPYGYEPDTHAP
jgi:hypothetical protein